MAGRQLDTQFVGLRLEILHKGGDAGRDGAEIMVGQLLVLGGIVADHGPVAQFQVDPGIEQGFVRQEIFLLQADVGGNAADMAVKEFGNVGGRLIQRLQGTEQGDFHIQGFTGIGYEYRRDTQGAVQDKDRRSRVPGGIAARFKGIAQTAVGETGGIRFLLDEGIAAETLEGSPLLHRDKSLVLFCRCPCKWLEEMGIMRRTVLQGPGFHGRSNLVGHAPVDLFPGIHRRNDGIIGRA